MKRPLESDYTSQAAYTRALEMYCEDYGDALPIAYQSGYYDGKKAALASLEQNFCPLCGKRTWNIHTCTPPKENT